MSTSALQSQASKAADRQRTIAVPASAPTVFDGAHAACLQTLLWRLREMAWRGLARMYQPKQRLFVFRHRRTANGIVAEGLSRRYTVIVLIGLAAEEPAQTRAVLQEHAPEQLCGWLAAEPEALDDLGDAALALWAAARCGYSQREPLRRRLLDLAPLAASQPTVHLAWVLDAVLNDGSKEMAGLAGAIAARLMRSFSPRSGLFPHRVEDHGHWRAHVSCFADQVYPIHALANYARCGGPEGARALDIAARAAERICALQGAAGQWWWHYDYRTGAVIEGYPVYAVHQDAMAPMALFALQEAGGPDLREAIARGLDWLAASPELDGRSLVDPQSDLIWRKVARREPGKLVRAAQAIASRLHPSWRVPAVERLFPPTKVDYEDRPYHLGWLLYAWPSERVHAWAEADNDEPANEVKG